MRAVVVSVLLMVLVTSSLAAPNRRFLLDDFEHVVHAVVDPVVDTVKGAFHALVNEFNTIVGGHVTIQTVACRIPLDTSGTTQQKIDDCTNTCMANANTYLGGDAADTAPSACPIACKYAIDHPTQYTC